MFGRLRILGVISAVLSALSMWGLAPVDLVPRWLSLGSSDRVEVGLLDGVDHLQVPDGFVRDTVGLRVPEANSRLAGRGLLVYTQSLATALTGYKSALMVVSDGVMLTVVLGRVVKAERPAVI